MSFRLQNLWNFGGSWGGLDGQFNEGYMIKLDEFLSSQRANGFYPAEADIFKAFEATPLDKVKVVIVGQDPYTDGSATGLAFSIPKDRELHPSLRNIYCALESDLGHPVARCGDLTHWAAQGLLLSEQRSDRSRQRKVPFAPQGRLVDEIHQPGAETHRCGAPRGRLLPLGSASRGQEEVPRPQQLRSRPDGVSSLAEDVSKSRYAVTQA